MLNSAYRKKINGTVLGFLVLSFVASGCTNNLRKTPTTKTLAVAQQKKQQQNVVVVHKPRQVAGARETRSRDEHHVAHDKKRMWYNQQWLVKQTTEARQRVERQKYQQQYQQRQQQYQQKQQQQARERQIQERAQQQQAAVRQQYHNRYRLKQAQIEARQQQNNWQRNAAVNQQRVRRAPQPRQRHYSQAANHNKTDLAKHLSNAAISRTRQRIRYDGRYIPISYPMGDVPANMGVCTDVVVRSYRRLGIDLQRLVHEDMSRAFHAYPNLAKWRLAAPDPNIDHRRVHNLRAFFARNGQRLPVTNDPRHYRPGDLVTWSLGGDQGHIGIVVDRRSPVDPNRYMIVHNISSGTKMEDVLFSWPITGHFRYFPGRQPYLASAR